MKTLKTILLTLGTSLLLLSTGCKKAPNNPPQSTTNQTPSTSKKIRVYLDDRDSRNIGCPFGMFAFSMKQDTSGEIDWTANDWDHCIVNYSNPPRFLHDTTFYLLQGRNIRMISQNCQSQPKNFITLRVYVDGVLTQDIEDAQQEFDFTIKNY